MSTSKTLFVRAKECLQSGVDKIFPEDRNIQAWQVLLISLFANLFLTIFKGIGFILTLSPIILSEFVISAASGLTQIFVYYGYKRSQLPPDSSHPFGYGKSGYFYTLVSTVSIYTTFTIYNLYYGVQSLFEDGYSFDPWVLFWIIAVSFILKSYSLWLSYYRFNFTTRGAKASFLSRMNSSSDLVTVAVMSQDTIALITLLVSGIGLYLAVSFDSYLLINLAAIIIAIMTGILGVYLVLQTQNFLTDASDSYLERRAYQICEDNVAVAKIFSIRSIVIRQDFSLLIIQITLEPSIQKTAMALGRIEDIPKAIRKSIQERVPRAKEVFIEIV